MILLKSASKIAFLSLVFTSCAAFLWGKLEAKDFMVLASAGVTFYFSNKGEIGKPFAGK